MATKTVSKAAVVAQLMADPELVNMLRQSLGVPAPKPVEVKWSIERADAKDGSKGVRLQFNNKLPRWMYLSELETLMKPETIKEIREFIAKQ